MEKIFQRFDLDVEKLMSEDAPTFDINDITSVARTLRSELISRGYSVLESNTMVAGLHESVIVGGELGMQHKQDFYKIAGRFNLPYNSGDCYFSYQDRNAGEN